MRLVVNSERLSGHSQTNKYPALYVRNGKGPGGGALICTIETFHWFAFRCAAKLQRCGSRIKRASKLRVGSSSITTLV